MRISVDDPGYPEALHRLPKPPPFLVTSGPLPSARAVTIAGSRSACEGSLDCAFALGFHLARAGVIVVSGGALGVDGEAHRGALAAGGATWVVSPSGKNHVQPRAHAELFETIARSETSRMIWPLPDDEREQFLFRNSVAVALSEAVIVVEARIQSGSRNTARWARQLGRPLWVVPGCPWDYAFSGSTEELQRGARPLYAFEPLFEALELPPPDLDHPKARRGDAPAALPRRPSGRVARPIRLVEPGPKVDQRTWTKEEKLVFSMLSLGPTHREAILEKSNLPVSSTVTALLTLSLKDVVVEGPDGFFRRRTAR